MRPCAPIVALFAVATLLTACEASVRRRDCVAAGTAYVDRCVLPEGPPETIEVDDPGPGERHEIYDLPDTRELWDAAPEEGLVASYRAAVSARLGGAIEPLTLLERQRAIMRLATNGKGDAANGTYVLEGKVGVLGPANCLEAMLWKRQAMRYPMLEHPTEFSAFILRGRGRVRVFVSGADRVGQKMRGEVVDRVAAEVSGGFELTTHAHNHPFLFDRVVGDRMWTTPATKDDVAGALAPSIHDVRVYRELREHLGLRSAWVTNGFDSGRFRAADFAVLEAATK
jgi:hypothetical protein